jgi:hypothetical protein
MAAVRPATAGAFGLDDVSRGFREATLTGLREWPDFPDGGPAFPPIGDDCLGRMASAAARGGRFVQTAASGNALSSVDANGITSLSPSSGSADDIVRILGSFPTPQPAGRTVLFPRAGGGTLAAELTGVGWTANVIEVIVPEPSGEGPVGFGTASDEAGGADPTAVIEFSDTLVSCLGVRAAGIAGRLNGVAPGATLTVRQPIPTLPNNANVFHGGPVLSKVSAAGGTELDSAFTVTGLNLVSGDTMYLDSTPCTTTFVSATQLTFRVPAIVSGHKLLRIGRRHHRSNGTGFEVRATLNPMTPADRVTPDTYARLTGTGFGPDITATVDGRSTRLSVVDTHTVDVLVTRPAGPPAATDKAGEHVAVDVFDRYVSLGTVSVTIDTFRIASFGDSVVWGQGVLPAQRFPMLVADVITARRNNRIAVYALDHCARAGAFISAFTGEAANGVIPRNPTDFSGECFSTPESITNQVGAWTGRAALNAERSQIDLVILDGGINDIGVGTILDPFGDDTALAASTLALYATGGPFDTLLRRVLTTFPSARIVVTGYYPIVSPLSNIEFLIPLLAHVGLLVGFATSLVSGVLVAIAPGAPIGPVGFGPIASIVFKAWLQGRLSGRSATFAAIANAALAALVTTTAAANPTRRIAFAPPQFGPQNSIFAPDAFLYGVTASLGPEDPVATSRATACPPMGAGGIPTTIASIGHPNAKGAQAYADAIAAVLPSLGL